MNQQLSKYILEAASVSYCLTNESYQILDASVHFYAMLGISESDKTTTQLYDILTSIQAEPKSKLDLSTSQIDLRIERNTAIVQLRISRNTLPIEPSYLLFLFNDVTTQNQFEQDLTEANISLNRADDQLQAVLDAVPAYISWVDKNGIYLGVNQHLSSLLGLRYSDMIGKRIGFRGDDVFEQIVTTFFASPERQISAEFRVTVDDKSLVTLLFGHKYANESAAVFVGVDITQRKLMEEQLREQAKLLDVTRDAILVVDEHDTILFWNSGAEALYGWKREDAVGNKQSDLLYSTDEFKNHFEAQGAVFAQGDWQGELKERTRSGKKIIVESRRTCLDSIGQQVKKVLIVNSDVTEKKELEIQLLRNQRVENIGMIASGIAHDMNNVLTPIMASLQMLKEKLSDDKSMKRIAMLESSAYRGKQLMEQILNFARGQDSDMSVFDVRHVVHDITTIIEQTFSKSITFEHSIERNIPQMVGNPTQIHQVLLNLAVNARDAMPNGGTLSLNVEKVIISEEKARANVDAFPGEYLKFSIKDSGEGIAPHILNKIFDPFFTTKEEGKGTGLGLSTVLSIVRTHKGFIDVQSIINKGTTFYIFFPTNPLLTKDNSTNQPNHSPAIVKGQRILVVDDDEAVAEVASELLSGAGYETLIAHNGKEAMEIFSQYVPNIHLILTDMVMPLMDGVALIKSLRSVQPNIKVVAMSGLMDKDKLIKMADLETHAFITKPFTGDTLLKTIRELLTAKV